MSIVDVESFGFSSSWGDFITYNRMLTWGTGGSYGNSGTLTIGNGGLLGDPTLTFGFGNGGYAANVSWQRRVLPGGPFQSGGKCIRFSTAPGAVGKIKWHDLINGVVHASVSFDGSTGIVRLYSGDMDNGGVLVIATALAQFPINALFHAEAQISIGSGTSGSFALRLLGQNLILNLTGINTQTGSRALYDLTEFRIDGVGGQTLYCQHVLWYSLAGTVNTGWIGDRRVYGGVVVSNGDQNNFTPIGNAQNWQNVAENPPNVADYNESSTVGAIDLYKVTAPSNVTAVTAIMVSAICKKDDAGSRSTATLLKSGGVVGTGPTVALADSYTSQSNVWETDPSTGVAFVASALNSIQPGIEVVA